MKYALFLQNPWSSVHAGCLWKRESWLKSLMQSRSGMWLRRILPDIDRVHLDNTTEAVAATSSGVCPPDYEHMIATLEEVKPEAVIACGKQAGNCMLELWQGRLLLMPHPSWHLFSNLLADEIRMILEEDSFERIAITTRGPGQIVIKEVACPTC